MAIWPYGGTYIDYESFEGAKCFCLSLIHSVLRTKTEPLKVKDNTVQAVDSEKKAT